MLSQELSFMSLLQRFLQSPSPQCGGSVDGQSGGLCVGYVLQINYPNITTSVVTVVTTDSSDNGRHPQEPMEIVKDVFVIFLAGIAIVVGIALIVYLVMRCMDVVERNRNRNSGNEDALDRSMLCRKANLWGLSLMERKNVLVQVFQDTSYTYGEAHRIENQHILGEDTRDIEMGDIPAATFLVVNDSLEVKQSGDAPNESEHENVISQRSSACDDNEANDSVYDDNLDHARMCCICLAPYEDGDVVMTGTQCSHRLHLRCCLQWLKQHDHCPYCRMEMAQPHQFRSAAVAVLGEWRVQSLGLSPSRVIVFPDNILHENNNDNGTSILSENNSMNGTYFPDPANNVTGDLSEINRTI